MTLEVGEETARLLIEEAERNRLPLDDYLRSLATQKRFEDTHAWLVAFHREHGLRPLPDVALTREGMYEEAVAP